MVIDKSGSMHTLCEATVEGFNEYLETAQRETPDAIMSVTLFDTERVELHVAEPIGKIPMLTEERYREGGMGNTALNDAVASTILAIENSEYSKHRRILVAVTTDGLENASTEWTRDRLAGLIKQKEAAGWKFVFFGANIDVQKEASSMSIPASRSVPYAASAAGTREVYRKIAHASTGYARGDDEETWTAELTKPEK
jgi:hypothetical protein